MQSPVVVWFRDDLRLGDHPALHEAVARGGAVVPLYVLEDQDAGVWKPGGARRWWLHHALASLSGALEALGSRLILRTGRAEDVVPEVMAATGADAIWWNRSYAPWRVERDTRLKATWRDAGWDAQSFKGDVLYEPWEIEGPSGSGYRVFSPFWKNVLSRGEPDGPLPRVERCPSPGEWPTSESIDSLRLLPSLSWADAFSDHWSPGETGAHEMLEAFSGDAVARYHEERDRPDLRSTSRLSPHLAAGEITPRQIWYRMRDLEASLDPGEKRSMEHFLREVGWREFSMHLLFHAPSTMTDPLRPEFAHFPWQPDQERLVAWQRGRTGYPIVDAGMRELWETGWMHNRVRMVVASFLVKHLLQPWQEGARWFWDTLVDADAGNNTMGWQWAAGCGADAAPYFRVFNPMLQGVKFDPGGAYVRRWVPEIASLETRDIHAPWEASPARLEAAGVVLGETYPHPLVDHRAARARALDAFEELKKLREAGGL